MLLYVILFPQKERVSSRTEECVVCLMAKVDHLYFKNKSQVDEMF